MQNIVVIDSGIGGISVVNKLKYNLLANYTYIADIDNLPYGDLSSFELRAIANRLIKQAITYNPDIIIVACNTLSVASISSITRQFPDRVIYGCQPPIKQALQYTASSAVLLATPYVVEHTVQSCSLIKVGLSKLASMIEQSIGNRDINSYVEESITAQTEDTSFDSIVLGCTHYSHIRQKIACMYPNCKIFDSSDSIASYVKRRHKCKCDIDCESTLDVVVNTINDTKKEQCKKNIELIFKSY